MSSSFLNPEYHGNITPIIIDDFPCIGVNYNTEALYWDQTFTIHKMCLELTLYLKGGCMSLYQQRKKEIYLRIDF